MAQLVILGHKTRSKEVIEILEMLGGRNSRDYACNLPGYAYSIDEQGIIDLYISSSNSSITLTLEEFLEKYPYKVGDKVLREPYVGARQICEMRWDSDNNCIKYGIGVGEWFNVSQVQPYKEEAMEKINIAELLKDCPPGMELDCALYECAELDCVTNDKKYPIKIIIKDDITGDIRISLTKEGYYNPLHNPKCVIFPKGKTTWEGFHRPFKDGDILFYNHKSNNVKYAFIYKRRIDMHYLLQYCGWFSEKPYLSEQFNTKERIPLYENDDIRFATEEEKEKLFKAIKDNGYKWNPETKTLEKVDEPKFHEGDWIIRNNKYTGIPVKVIGFNDYYSCELNGEVVNLTRNDVHNNFHLWTIDDAKDGDVLAINWHEGDDSWEKIIIFKKYHNNGVEGLINSPCVEGYGNTFKNGKLVFHEEVPYFSKTWTANLHPATKEQCKLLFQKIKEAGYVWNAETKTLEEPIKPKFKVGDKIRGKYTHNIYTISCITPTEYNLTNGQSFTFDDEDCYELVPDKFDITTLKPFAEVLVRNTNNGRWHGQLYMSYNENEEYPFECVYNCWKQCIPYEGNEHLFNKTDDCTDYFKTWE